VEPVIPQEAVVRSSNPVLTRLTPETQSAPAYGPGYQTQPSYPPPSVVTTPSDRMTMDDVVVRTVALLAATGLSAAAAWVLIPDTLLGTAWIVSALVGLGLGLFISFKRITSPPLLFLYAVVEGVFVGAVSKFYESLWSGIVVQAVAGTFGIFLIMTALYKFRIIRNSPKFARVIGSAVIGIFAIYGISFLINLFSDATNPLFERNADGSGTWLAIGFSLVVVVIASLTLILDFDLIEQSIAHGAPKEVAWTCAFGLLVGLIWVYLEVLRLLSYLRGRD
jgi:uncharacterized YccA/Bax inhibitor family protein